ncbi:glycosyltransferase family A protein [Sphingomonas sp. CROZ-RG-20F-R02-07]|uniref:glycosyltransferase family 2 protein n=1 Tax=Sphingomonas sp. CROZ-RG-20F-R02-07 TaxID=2914832 RepID=UPI001F5806DD|nr:glycosyltransferase family A protein [Sphingomonas sp. CROZ-RG-20F-R02-07]
MLLDLDGYTLPAGAAAAYSSPSQPNAAWSVLVPFFNERELLGGTIASLAAQTRHARLILIDNGSTDGSADVAHEACRRLGLDYMLLTERRPGKVAALATGLRWVRTAFVATCDADTWYPADYLAEAEALLRRPGCAVAGAFFAARDADAETRLKAGRKICATARMLRGQCHTGGAGQAFRTDALRAGGGFCADRWSYVLEDHEIIHRVLKHGTMAYSERLWCAPSPRERNRDSIRWTLAERLVYATTSAIAGDWFFYRFLATRLRARQLTSDRIRERPFQAPAQPGPFATPAHAG